MRKRSIKMDRINEDVYRTLSEIIRNEVKDPRVGPMTSITSVEVAKDLKTAKIYVSVLGDEGALSGTMEGLTSSAGFIRGRLAKELNLPAVVHSRDATRDTLEVITAHPDVRGVLHCFGESWETAKFLLDRGWYLSFTGSVTFKNAKKAPAVAAKMPLDRLMLETDAPYMAPVPLRGHRNDSRNLRYTRDFIAALRGMDPEELEKITWENGKRFFGIA